MRRSITALLCTCRIIFTYCYEGDNTDVQVRPGVCRSYMSSLMPSLSRETGHDETITCLYTFDLLTK